jgi:DNA-binding NarL/FixJ family response regulator
MTKTADPAKPKFLKNHHLVANSIKLGIADDHDYWRRTVVEMITSHMPDMEVTVEARHGKELLERISSTGPDTCPSLILLDLNMPVMDGFATAYWLYRHKPEIKIVALSLQQDELTIIRLLGHGVMGFMQKNITWEELVSGIESVLTGKMYFSVFKNERGEDIHLDIDAVLKMKPIVDHWNCLSQLQQDIIRYCCADMTYQQIATAMKIDRTSVERMVTGLFATFEVKGRIGLVLLAYKYKLVGTASHWADTQMKAFRS